MIPQRICSAAVADVLHNFGSSVNSLGRRVSTYSTHDAKEIKKLLAQLP